MRKLIIALDLSKRYTAKFKGLYETAAADLKREVCDKTDLIEEGISGREEQLRKDYLGGLESLSRGIEPLIKEIKSDVKECCERERNRFAILFGLFEKQLGLDRINGIYFDSANTPVYATPGFYRMFDMSLASDLSTAHDLPKIIEQIKLKRKEPYKLEVASGKTEKNIEVSFRYALRSDKVIGAFVEYEHKTGFFGRLPFGGHAKEQRDKAGENLDILFNEGGAPSQAEPQ